MRDELAELLRLVRPRYFIPVHGEYRFLVEHAELARNTVKAIPVVADWGHIISVRKNKVEPMGELDLQQYYIEMPLIGSAQELKLKERRKLLFNGLVTVLCRLRKRKRALTVVPDVTLHGVPDPDGNLAEAIADRIREEFTDRSAGISAEVIQEKVRILARRVVKKRQNRKPDVHVLVEGT